MASPLPRTLQDDFSAGIMRGSARHLISSRGAYDIRDGLIDDDNTLFQRGGAQHLSTADFGSGRFLWQGQLGPGPRELIANTADFGVLDGADAPINLGLAGMAVPKRAVEVGGIVFVPGGVLYAGSRKTAAYTTGTVTATNGSKTVTGSGTTWNTLVDAGMLFQPTGDTRVYPVASIDSTTQITLRDAYQGTTGSGKNYRLDHIIQLGGPSPQYRMADLLAVAAGRLFSLEGNKAFFTPPDSPHSYAVTDYHELPEGATTIGGAGLGSRLLWFATNGMWTIDGLDFDIVDPFAGNQQHTVKHANPELILLSHEGIATWHQALVVPCTDGVWLVDGISAPVKVSTGIDPLWREYVAAGYKTGLAQVFRSHYIVPIINGSGVVQDQLVCRLDRQIQTSKGVVRPWTRLQGYGANVPAWATKATGAGDPTLIGVAAGTGRVLKCNGFFEKTAAVDVDADGTAPSFVLETRDYATKDAYGEGTVKDVALRYELEDSAAHNPTVSAQYAIDGGSYVALSGAGAEDTGDTPKRWWVRKKGRFVRFKFTVATRNAKMMVRSLQVRSRPSQRT